MISAILISLVLWCALFDRIPVFFLVPLCVAITFINVAFTLSHTHEHTRFLSIDIFAQISRLNKINASLKVITSLILMCICIAADSPGAGLFLTCALLLINVFAGGIKPRDYFHLLALPVSFMMMSGLALLFEFSNVASGVINIPVSNTWLIVSTTSQVRTILILSRALGALSCLYFLSLTTPMAELIGVLRRFRCPSLLITLMYLIYRYIFVLLTMYHTMRDAAKSRLGYINYRKNIRTTGNLYANLLSRSYRQSSRNFDAMESRGFDSDIRFLENYTPPTPKQIILAISLSALTLIFALFL